MEKEFLIEIGLYSDYMLYALGTIAAMFYGVIALTLVGFIHK